MEQLSSFDLVVILGWLLGIVILAKSGIDGVIKKRMSYLSFWSWDLWKWRQYEGDQALGLGLICLVLSFLCLLTWVGTVWWLLFLR